VGGRAAARPLRHGRAITLLMLGVLAVQVGWLLAVPAFHSIDEIDHVYRASSVARGHWQAGSVVPADGRGHLIPVPDDIVVAARGACATLDYVGPDNCSPTTEPDGDGQVLVASAAATYNPAWYFVAGTVARPFDGERADLAMRLCAMLLCDLAIGAALWLLAKRTASRWATMGIAVACTPVLLYSSVNASPNGLGYCAGLLLWASLLTLPRAPNESLIGPLAGVAVSAPAIMVTHSTGLMWVAMSFLCAAPLLVPRVRHLWIGSKGVVIAVTLVLAGAAAVSAAWVLLAGTNDPRAGDAADYGPVPAEILFQGLILWPLQSIATLRLRADAAPIEVYAVGVALMSVFVVAALRASRRAERVSIALIALASLAIPLAATAVAYPRLAAAWQGRYGLALSFGIIVVATTALARTPGPRVLTGWIAAVGLAIVHWATLAGMFRENLAGAAQPWTPWFVVGGAVVTTAAFGLAFTRPASLRG
jgi:hypothetical protein